MSIYGALHMMVPGPLDQRTGGYLYDARMVGELRARGRRVVVHELAGRFPRLDDQAIRSLSTALSSVRSHDIVVLDGLAGGLAGSVLASFRDRVRILALVHHPLGDEEGIPDEEARDLLEREIEMLQTLPGVIATSRFTAGRLSALGVEESRVRAVLPGTAPAPQALGPDEGDPPVLLCVGTLIPRKGQLDLVEALALIRDLPWRCVCVGSAARDNDYVGRVRDAIDRTDLEGRIVVTGELDQEALEEQWCAASIFVLPSSYEGYGMALTEAVARGLPVVSTTGGAIPWTVPPGAGILLPPGDVPELASTLRALLTDEDRRDRLATAARQAATRFADWPERAIDFERAIGELTA